MNDTPLNERTVTINVKRIDLCNLMLACTNMEYLLNQFGDDGRKWRELHDILSAARDTFDRAQDDLRISKENYTMKHAFFGTVTINPVNHAPFELTGNWTYKPEHKCWYCKGASWPEEILSNFREEASA